jgi:AcrR family transcriptional regulator
MRKLDKEWAMTTKKDLHSAVTDSEPVQTKPIPPRDKKDRILEALTACLQTKPFEKTSIRDIAREAGVNHGLLHYYFKSKEDILLHYIDHVIGLYRGLFNDWFSEQDMERDGKEVLRDFFRFTNERITCNAVLSKMFIEIWEIAAYNPAVREKLRKAYGEWIETLSALVNRYTGDPDRSKRIGTAVVAFLEGMAMFSIILDRDSIDFSTVLADFQEKIIEIL